VTTDLQLQNISACLTQRPLGKTTQLVYKFIYQTSVYWKKGNFTVRCRAKQCHKISYNICQYFLSYPSLKLYMYIYIYIN